MTEKVRKTVKKKSPPPKKKTAKTPPVRQRKPTTKTASPKSKGGVKNPALEESVIGDIGRPTKYQPAFAEEAYRYCLLVNATDKQLAEYFAVAESTIYLWKKEHPTFSESIRKGKVAADAQVAEGLFKRAVGMTLPDVHIGMHKGKPVVTNLVKHIAPDVQAQRMWLKNRQDKHWKENIGLTDGNGGALGIVINESLKGDRAA